MDQIVITVVYDPQTKEVGTNVGRMGGILAVNLKEVLEALHAALGVYLARLSVEEPIKDTE